MFKNDVNIFYQNVAFRKEAEIGVGMKGGSSKS